MKKIVILVSILSLFSLSGTVLAAVGNWGSLKTIDIKSTDDWKKTTVNDYKTDSAETKVDFYTASKTMYSNPSVKMVNSSNTVRSGTTTLQNQRTTTASNNTGSSGYYYYASVKPAWNQVGTDSAKFQMRAR